jgi:hypothetical protein
MIPFLESKETLRCSLCSVSCQLHIRFTNDRLYSSLEVCRLRMDLHLGLRLNVGVWRLGKSRLIHIRRPHCPLVTCCVKRGQRKDKTKVDENERVKLQTLKSFKISKLISKITEQRLNNLKRLNKGKGNSLGAK